MVDYSTLMEKHEQRTQLERISQSRVKEITPSGYATSFPFVTVPNRRKSPAPWGK